MQLPKASLRAERGEEDVRYRPVEPDVRASAAA
jgi:hypothetical protein